jgi:raffinose/stachyose/melibiose transport system substrate-binding protein
MKKSGNDEQTLSWLQHLGYGIIGLFFLYSTIHVLFLSQKEILDPEVETITVSHWLLEAGVREGFDAVFREFEKEMASKGRKVKVKQSTIPGRGFKQWFVTQLISGEPGDIMGMSWETSSEFIKQYFTPLTPFIGEPNPYNAGTPLEKLSWRDSFVDNMESGRIIRGERTADYYQAAWSFNVYRLYANLDLLEAATGNREAPHTLTEFLEDCAAIEQYGLDHNRPIVPIGVRGIDRGTIQMFFWQYFNQTNGNFVEQSIHDGVPRSYMLDLLLHDEEARERMVAVVDILRQIGRYFGDGFQATDREQSLFRFFSGDAGFYYSGSWIVQGMLENAPFELGVLPVPQLAGDHELSRFYTGRIAESGIRGGTSLGIPKATKNKALALDLLKFMTSWKMNQVIAEHCSFPPIVRDARFEGVLASFKPFMEGSTHVGPPFEIGPQSSTSITKLLEDLETVIADRREDGGDYVFKRLLSRRDMILGEIDEAVASALRQYLDSERTRTRAFMGIMGGHLDDAQQQLLQTEQMNQAQLAGALKQHLYIEQHTLRGLVEGFSDE